MKLSKINVDLTRFVAFVEAGCCFGRAAEQCHLTRQAYSGWMRSFENKLGISLTCRSSSNKVLLTRRGRGFFNYACHGISEEQEYFKNLRNPSSSSLRIGRILFWKGRLIKMRKYSKLPKAVLALVTFVFALVPIAK